MGSSSTFGATSRLPTSCSASSWRAGCTRVRGTSSPSTTSSRTSTPRRRPTRTTARSTGSRGTSATTTSTTTFATCRGRGVIWDYIMRQEVGPYNRMKRSVPVGDFGAAEAVLKAVWCCCQILTYALRPMFIKAQDFTPNHLYNWISQIAFDLVVFYFWGYKPLAYFVLCIFLAGGLHPCAGHFISEHYVFPHLDATQETYSYYGPLNWLTWNVGYHNEHHDFCNVPWSRLPALKRCAPEFYDN